MQHSTRSSRSVALTTAALTLTALTAGGLAAAGPASADGAAVVGLFPSNAATTADDTQLTGRRITLPTPAGCPDPSKAATCGLYERLNQLDGFSLDPRLTLRFNGPVVLADVIASTTITGPNGFTTGIDRVVHDTANNIVYAHPAKQLFARNTYTLAVSSDHGLTGNATPFTTMSAANGLFSLRRQLDDGSAYTAAGIAPADRLLKVDAVVPTNGTSFSYKADMGSGNLFESAVPVLSPGKVVFGSYAAPSWLRDDLTIEQTPTTGSGPAAVGSKRLPFIAFLPAGTAPAGGWPTAVFGHGFSRNDSDVFEAAEANAKNGVATIGTDVVGHGYGPASAWTYTRNNVTTTLPAYARGVDQNGDGAIGAIEGAYAAPGTAAAAVSTRDTLRQTALDVMSLVRAVSGGLDAGGTPASDLKTTDVDYFGQSFGAIYGAMVEGADPKVRRSALNDGGAPVVEVARLSTSFRPLLQQALAVAGLLNSGDANRNNFQEDLPLRGQAPVVDPVPGALAIQAFLDAVTWLGQSGSPEAYTPQINDAQVLLQFAYGDQTVPNPTNYTLASSGNLFPRTALYRNDRTANKNRNPHGFLLDFFVFNTAQDQGQQQITTFLKTGNTTDPDGSKSVWQVPAPKNVLLPLNFDSPAFP